jgi:DNA-binding response OmpR family regulator
LKVEIAGPTFIFRNVPQGDVRSRSELISEDIAQHLRKPFHIEELLAQVQVTIVQARENNRAIRASLDRLFQTAGVWQNDGWLTCANKWKIPSRARDNLATDRTANVCARKGRRVAIGSRRAAGAARN